MAKISKSQYEAAFEAGLKLNADPAWGITNAKRQAAKSGLNPESAVNFIYNVRHMLRSEVYKRAMSIAATEDFLNWIKERLGDKQLSKAIKAVLLHIDYYEKTHPGARLRAHRQIVQRIRKQAALPGSVGVDHQDALRIEWLDRSARGYVDVMPFTWFEKVGTSKALDHVVIRTTGGGENLARCNVLVETDRAELDYSAHGDFNIAHGMELGTARIYFTDENRTQVLRLEWRRDGAARFVESAFKKVDIQLADEVEYRPALEKAPQKPVMLRERPGQTRFKHRLVSAYNGTCCVSGCKVAHVLQAAHIDEYRSKASHNLQNGLLLRSDIHALFDRNLLAIEPNSHVINLSEAVCLDPVYANLHGKALSLPSNPTHAPSYSALMRRWETFNSSLPVKTG